MFGLFKDPIVTVAWLNFDHANQTVKNGLVTSYFFLKNN